MASGWAWRTLYQKAVTVWPLRIRPDASVTVPLMISGRRSPVASNTSSIANNAALALRVSKMVSTISTSLPPSISALACSKYAARNCSKLMLRAPGSLTSGLMLAVLGVGPSAPTTKRGLSGVLNLSQAARAMRAEARFISPARSAMS